MSINKFVKNFDVLKAKAPSGLTYAQELVNAANLLRDCIQSRINRATMTDVLSTADLADVKVDGNRLSVSLKVQNALRPSIFYKWNRKNANVFWLLNDGFTVKKNVWFKNIKNFGYRSAENFVEKGIADFNLKNNLGVEIKVKRPLLYYG